MIVALLLACAGRVPAGDTLVADVPAPERYAASARAATRELRLYEGLSTALLLRAAHLDPAFRRAQEALRAHLLLLSPGEQASRLAASLEEAEESHVFVFAADSQWRDDLRFDFDGATPWRVRLFAGERECAPERIERFEPTAMDERVYPFLNRWSTHWVARFLTDCGRSEPLILQFTGPRGAGELEWRAEMTG